MGRLIFDTHAHYTLEAFNPNRAELLQNLPAQGVALIVNCGADMESSGQSLALARQYACVYAAAGIHPTSLIEDDASTVLRFKGDWRAEMRAMEPLYDDAKTVAVGEVGLDYHWPVPRDAQLELFEAEIRFAMERELPLIIHDREAHAEIYAFLKKYRPKGVLHAFSGTEEDVQWLCGQGLYIGFGGAVTFKNAHRSLRAAAAVPMEYLLLETDCPYMAPEPFRGKQSHSGMVQYTAAKIAEARGTDTEPLLAATLANGKRLFGIGP
jgi:TatD DNase family protein